MLEAAVQIAVVRQLTRCEVTETIKSKVISRRTAFALIGGAIGLALPATFLSVSEAEAQTPGMQRREDRRGNRQDRREDRRGNRQDRRDSRRGVSGQPPTTGGK